MSEARRVVVEVEVSQKGVRLDTFLAGQFPVVTRGAIQRLILEQHILVNGGPAKPSQSPKLGDLIEVNWPPPKSDKAEPEDIPIDVLYEDKDLIVINKAPDIVVHPASGTEKGTLVNALLHHCHGQLSGIGGVARPGIVHRLDKETSGCLVVAKNDQAHVELARQFKERETEKRYFCLTCRRPPEDAGDIKASIARHPNHRKVMAVNHDHGRPSWTGYRVYEHLNSSAWVEATLHTGRTHQIRVHFSHIGCPLVGDSAYGKGANNDLYQHTGIRAKRQMLHARKLAFTHPTQGERLSLLAPVPEDFRNVARALGSIKTDDL